MSSDERYSELQTIAGPVSRETYERLEQFERLFRKWAAKINLAAPSTLDSVWNRHILDSAQLLPLAPDATRWLDLGSGGGFPGVVLAILLRDRPGAAIELVESNAKKAAFLRTAMGELQGCGRVNQIRIEEYRPEKPQFEIVTARALAPLRDLLRLAQPWLGGTAKGLFHKGRDYRREVEESRDAWQFDLLEHASAVDPESVVLEISGLRPR